MVEKDQIDGMPVSFIMNTVSTVPRRFPNPFRRHSKIHRYMILFFKTESCSGHNRLNDMIRERGAGRRKGEWDGW